MRAETAYVAVFLRKAKRSRTALLRKKRDSRAILTRLSQSRSLDLAVSQEILSYIAHLFWERTPGRVCLLNLGTSFLIYIFIYLLFSPAGNIFFMVTPPLVTEKAWLLGLLMITVMLDRGLGGELQPSGACVPLPQPPPHPHPHLHPVAHHSIDVIGCDTPRPLDVMWINRAPATEQETLPFRTVSATECLSIRLHQSKAVLSEECIHKSVYYTQ